MPACVSAASVGNAWVSSGPATASTRSPRNANACASPPRAAGRACEGVKPSGVCIGKRPGDSRHYRGSGEPWPARRTPPRPAHNSGVRVGPGPNFAALWRRGRTLRRNSGLAPAPARRPCRRRARGAGSDVHAADACAGRPATIECDPWARARRRGRSGSAAAPAAADARRRRAHSPARDATRASAAARAPACPSPPRARWRPRARSPARPARRRRSACRSTARCGRRSPAFR